MKNCPDRDEIEKLMNESLSPERTSEIAAHIDTCVDCRATIEQLAEDSDTTEAQPLPDFLDLLRQKSPDELIDDDEWQSSLLHGEDSDEIGRLGDYAITEILGQGGMGIVLRGRDLKLNRDVAIKIMRPSLALKPQYRDRFLREARAMAAIDHPHVIPVYHVTEHEGTPFMVMKCLQGETLAARMKRSGPLRETFLSKLAKEAISGLAAAHECGNLHRDIKPENIWLESPGDNVRLLDFGLARPNDETRLTSDGTVMGTPAYMSPEQARGAKVDERSDYFSLGAVLYEAASGKLPFPGESIVEVLSALANDSPTNLRQNSSHLSAEFASMVMKLLAKDMDDRPSDSESLLRLIQPKSALQRSRFGVGLFVGVLVAAILYGVIVLQLQTPTGTLIVELADGIDPQAVSIQANNNGKVTIIDANKGWRINIDEGEYSVSMQSGTDQFKLDKQSVTVVRGGKQYLRVYQKGDPSTSGPPSTVAIDSKDTPSSGPPRASKEVQQEFARWLVSVGGSIHAANHPTVITTADQIPDKLLHIHTLDMIDADIQDKDLERIFQLGRVYRVQVGSRKTKTQLTDEAIPRLAQLGKLWVKDLQMRDMNLQGPGLKHLANLTWLTTLAVDGGDFVDNDLRELSSLKHLRHLTLRRCNLTGAGLTHLKGSPIESLQIEDAALESDALIKMPGWKTLVSLTVKAPNSSVNDLAILSLGKYPNLTSLKLIGLANVTKSGLEVLSRFRELEFLVLSSPAVSDSTLKTIGSDLPKLKELVLRVDMSNITEEGFNHLASAKQLKKIDFGTGDYRPPKEIVQRLRTALPECVIP